MSEDIFQHRNNKQRIANNIASSYQIATPIAVEQQQTQTPFERQQLIKSQIADSFRTDTPILSNEELEKSADDNLEKGGKKAVVGEKRTFGGREYIKTANGWKFHGKGGGKKATEHRNAALDHHVNEKTGTEEKKEGKLTAQDHLKIVQDNNVKLAKFQNEFGAKLPNLSKEDLATYDALKKEQKKHMALKNKLESSANPKEQSWGEKAATMSTEEFEQALKEDNKPKATHISDMSATQMKQAADKLGIDVKGKSVKQVRQAISDANIDKQIADFKAKKNDSEEQKRRSVKSTPINRTPRRD